MGRTKVPLTDAGNPTDVGPSGTDTVLTVTEFARTFRVSTMTVHRMIDRGEVHAVKLGDRTLRIPASEVDRLMAGAA